MKENDRKQRIKKLNLQLNQAILDLDNLNKKHEENESEIMKVYRTVQDFSVDHTTAMKAKKKMEEIKTANKKVFNSIKSRDKKIKEYREDLEKLNR